MHSVCIPRQKKGKIDAGSWFEWEAYLPHLFTKFNVDTLQLCNTSYFSATFCSLYVLSQPGPGETLSLVSSLTDTDTGAASPPLSEK